MQAIDHQLYFSTFEHKHCQKSKNQQMKIKIKSASTCKTVDLNVVFNRSVKTRERPTPESQEREIPSVCPPGEE